MNSPSPDADSTDLALLKQAALACGPLLRETYGGTVKTWSKGDAGPVTEIDLEVNSMLRKRLTEARPDYGWMSEESADDPARLARERVFIVDPIDGTRAFIAGVPEFCVALAVVAKSAAVASVVYNPVTHELFEAHAGGGARRNEQAISVTATDALADSRMIGRPAFFTSRRWTRPWPPLEAEHKIAMSYRLALVAAGAFDGMVALGFKHDWDVAAGALLVSEAGGLATDPWDAPLRFNQPVPRSPGVVASGRALHPLLIERVSVTAHPGAPRRSERKGS